jgi:outer membrane receptor for ferrienterochelin and colicins
MLNKKTRIIAKLALVGAIAATTQTNIIHAEELEELEPYVMISKFRSVDTELLPITLTTLDEKSLYENGIGTMSDALEEAPGVFIQTNSGRIKRPSIRGTSNNHSLVLIDGRRMVSGFKGLADLGQILSCGIQRVDIIRGPSSAMYGSDAIGGVINIITKRAKSETFHGTTRVQGDTGEWDAYSATASGGQKIGKVGIFGSMGYRHTNEWESGDGAPSDVDDVDSFGALANIDYYISKNQKILSGIQYSKTQRVGMRPKQGSSERTTDEERIGAYSTYVHTFSDDTMAQVRVYGEKYSNTIRFDLPTDKFDYDLKTELWSIDAYINKQFTEYLQVTAGGDISSTDQEEPLASTEKSTQDRSAVFAQALWSPAENLKTMLGTRVDHYDEFGDYTSPRIAFKYKLADGLFLSASFGKGFRAPSIAEQKIESCANGGKITILPNPDLTPESSKSYDIGLEYNKGPICFSITAFHTDVEDMIEAITLTSKTQQWMNVSEVEIDGIESQLTVKINETLRIKTQLDWLDPVNKNTGQHLENQHRLNGRIMLIKKLPDWGIRARIGLHYEGKEWTSDGSTEDAAWVVNAKIEKEINDNWSVYCGSKNLTDTDKTDWPARYYIGVKFKQ